MSMFISGSSTSTGSFAHIRGGGGTATDSTGTVSFEIKSSKKYGKYLWRNWQKSGKLIQRKKWFQIMQKPTF